VGDDPVDPEIVEDIMDEPTYSEEDPKGFPVPQGIVVGGDYVPEIVIEEEPAKPKPKK